MDIEQIDWNLYTDCGCQRDFVLVGPYWQPEYDDSEILLDDGAIGRSAFRSNPPVTQTANGKCPIRHLANRSNSSVDRTTKFRERGILILGIDSDSSIRGTH